MAIVLFFFFFGSTPYSVPNSSFRGGLPSPGVNMGSGITQIVASTIMNRLYLESARKNCNIGADRSSVSG